MGATLTDPPPPEMLRAHYRSFLKPGRVLLTGHSHQAWPDVARDGLLASFIDAAEWADDKWEHAFAAAEVVRQGVAERIRCRPGDVALAQSTHELVVRFLSALDLDKRRHLVTTSGEFHSIDRQLRRLAEAGLRVDFVDPEPVDTLGERLAAAVRDDTAAVLASTVLFETSSVVRGLDVAARAARRVGAWPLFDAYHAVGVVPFSVDEFGHDAFVVGGGYKYLQWGEGVCFMRIPTHCELRPVVTGWFADFEHLADRRGATVQYASGGQRFAGATYDPASHYRARAVIEFFSQLGLSTDRLWAGAMRQTQRILEALEGYDIRSPRDMISRGGFVAVRVANARETVHTLRERGIYVDARGDTVRLGPAPYVTDDEIDAGVAALREVAKRAPG